MIRRPPRSTHFISSAASDVYKRQGNHDIDTIFIDSVLKQADISLNNISAFMTSLSKISAENTLDFFISVGAEKESIPDIDSDNYNVLN